MPHYSFDADGVFIIDQYNDSAPFASFLPGIAGATGIPAWVFYVNRGQAIASFGVRNKDNAFLEFYPADKAYQLTASRGFRTFLKITGDGPAQTHEPFQRGAGDGVRQRLSVSPHEVGVEEIHPGLGLAIRADCFTLPEAPLAGLVRRVSLANTSTHAKTVEIVDGLPHVLPHGLNQWCVKFMSRTMEAYMLIEEGLAEDAPFFRLKVEPTDKPLVEPVVAGNFFAGFVEGRRTRVIVDAETVFGLAGDFSRAERFFADAPLNLAKQVAGNRTPSAFQTLTLTLAPGESRVFYGLYGHARSWAAAQAFLAGIDAGYFEAKREANRRLIENLTRPTFTVTAYPLFDAYVRQCHLDNGLRGGFPVPVPGGARLHVYGRKHGDLERDYNDFLLQDSPYSEGNGDFRDMLQNRRTDVFFDPALDARDIRYFFNLIQPDGYNPMALRNTRFVVENPDAFAQYPGLEKVLSKPFKYAELWQAVQELENSESVIAAVLQAAHEIEDAEFDRGYWSDHWTYLVDLLESYAGVFPDRIAGLFDGKTYTFFDPTHYVLPRAKKYIKTSRGLRQTGAVESRKDKIGLIATRGKRLYQVRDNAGKGAIVTTTLLGKILTLVVNKLASLDPYGVGIEMEADRPGWCDALNGLPGLLGSSVNETIELKRLVDFTRTAIENCDGECPLPVELAVFMDGLETLLNRPGLSAEVFWRESHDQKEAYREQVFMGFDGAQRLVGHAPIQRFLSAVSAYLDQAIAKARTPDGITTYFTYHADEYRADETKFQQRKVPLFLEGFVHALRIASPEDAKTLYQAVRDSELFDQALGMYRVNVPLGDALELGRIGMFNYGWLENGSIFLHMHYKFVLEMARRGLVEEFYKNAKTLLIPFRNPAEYRRSTTENSSFLVSSGFTVDPREHGRGCVARLSGSTVEFLHLWLYLFLGCAPFVFENGRLLFRPMPSLAKDFFTTGEQRINPFGVADEVLPRDSVACALLGNTLLAYINPSRSDTFGPAAVKPCRYQLYGRDGSLQTIDGACLEGETAENLRLGILRRVDVLLGGDAQYR